jgi:hypothetical protein
VTARALDFQRIPRSGNNDETALNNIGLDDFLKLKD